MLREVVGLGFLDGGFGFLWVLFFFWFCYRGDINVMFYSVEFEIN